MSPREVALHLRKKAFQWVDARGFHPESGQSLNPAEHFPLLPPVASAPELIRDNLKRDAVAILGGRWKAFGHLELQVDDPPQWHRDYLAGVSLQTNESAFRLNHRELPGDADIKLVWELSRWYALVRLAQAAYVVEDLLAGETSLRWLDDWVENNPPFRGWNWTSALESGMRLIQFTWMDALLSKAKHNNSFEEKLRILRERILPAHVHFTWRYRSFGSSANNHLLGELAGLILALARWPELEKSAAPLTKLARLWEREVLAQFAPDGGSLEQALNYQLFSWEFCWQTRLALRAVDCFISPEVEAEPWDYGDSDSAFVTPLFSSGATAVSEWRNWMIEPTRSPSIDWWLGLERINLNSVENKTSCEGSASGNWVIFQDSGHAVKREGEWMLHLDLSPLGYLATAAHGHLDALHLSLWLRNQAVVIDPGTGAYFADRTLRNYLASWEAHNGPHRPGETFPKRGGPFLWLKHHRKPVWEMEPDGSLKGELELPSGTIQRVVKLEYNNVVVEDVFSPASGEGEQTFNVNWQFSPQAKVEQLSRDAFRIQLREGALKVVLEGDWSVAELRLPGGATSRDGFCGVCSPRFREVMRSPVLQLTGSPVAGKRFVTRFISLS